MTDTDRVTAGPWEVEKNPENPCFAEINGARGRTNLSAWYALAKVVVRMDEDDKDSPSGRANLGFIMSAINACFEVADNDPTRAPLIAAEIGEAFRLLTEALQMFELDDRCNDPDDDAYVWRHHTSDLLQRIQTKSGGVDG